MNTLFFGTPRFAAEVLTFLLQEGITIQAVVTQPDRPKGRSKQLVPPPVKEVALASGLPVYQPEKASDPEFAATLTAYSPDLFVVVAYGEIIKEHLLEMPKKGCINLHASLLPDYRGAAPIQRCLIDGATETGVTIIHMAKKMDAGDIIETVTVPIEPNTTFEELTHTLCQKGKKLLLNVIHTFAQGPVNRTPQDHSLATFAPKIELEDCKIDWSLPAESIHNLIRGVSPSPGAWCLVNIQKERKRLKIFRSEVISPLSGHPGELLSFGKEDLIIACGTGALLIHDVQLEGKKRMEASVWMRGTPQDHLQLLQE